MKHFKNSIIRGLYLMVAITVLAACTGNNKSEVNTFYIESQEDFDKYSGIEFPEDSKILFAAGKEFQGEFIIKGSGTKENPNFAGAFDPKNKTEFQEWIENKPVINGLGKTNAPVYLYNGNIGK
jgi:hypothetical protein